MSPPSCGSAWRYPAISSFIGETDTLAIFLKRTFSGVVTDQGRGEPACGGVRRPSEGFPGAHHPRTRSALPLDTAPGTSGYSALTHAHHGGQRRCCGRATVPQFPHDTHGNRDRVPDTLSNAVSRHPPCRFIYPNNWS